MCKKQRQEVSELMLNVISTCDEILSASHKALSIAEDKNDTKHVEAFTDEIIAIEQIRTIADAIADDMRANASGKSIRVLLRLAPLNTKDLFGKVATRISLHARIIESFENAEKIANASLDFQNLFTAVKLTVSRFFNRSPWSEVSS